MRNLKPSLLGLAFWGLRRGGEILGGLKGAIAAKIKRMGDNHRPEGGPCLVSLCKQLQNNLEKAHPQTVNTPLYVSIMVPYSVRSLRGKGLLEGGPAKLENASRHDTPEACIITSVSRVV